MAVKEQRIDSLLGHCMARAMIANGVREPGQATPWAAMKATPKASRVAAFIALWAQALIDNDADEIGIEDFARWSGGSIRTAYRRQVDFRELWPEYETPNEIAYRVVVALVTRGSTRADASVAVAL